MQTYRYLTDYGGGVVVAPCDVAFLAEVAHCNAIGLLPGLTNLGQIGDKRHQATGSDHNPFVQGPSGLWYIRAHDFGGPKSTRQKLNAFWNWRYAQRDPRVYPYGYTNSADPAPYGLTIWFGGGATRHGTDGDHEHESVNRANTTTVGRAAWTPALDSRAPWGLEAYLRGGRAEPATEPPDSVEDDDDMQTVTLMPGERAYFNLSVKKRPTTLIIASLDGNAPLAVENDGSDMFPGGEQKGRFSIINVNGTRSYPIPANVHSICVLNEAERLAENGASRFKGKANAVGVSVE